MKKTILVATREITGGTRKGERETVKAQEELTKARAKSLGLDEDAIGKLVEAGALIEVPVHTADDDGKSDSAAVKAEKARADKAEGDLATAQTEIGTLKEKISELTTELEAANKAAAAASKP